MTLGRFVVKNAFRNSRRTFLTVGSIGFSLFLLITLRTALDQLVNPKRSKSSELRVAVRRSTSLADQLPVSYEREIQKIPHVQHTLPLQWCGFQYKEPKNFFANFATDPVKIWDMFPEYAASEETKKAFASERIGAIVGEELLKRFNWHVGDRVTLKGTIFPVDLEFKLVGTYHSDLQNNIFYFQFDYLNEAMGKPNRVGTYWIMADDAASIPGIIEAVDAKFRNSPAETKSETEKAFVLAFASMLGNIQMLVGSIAVVILFTMLLVTASTMAMTIRERFREVGILKSLGFPPRLVLGLILGEAVFISVLGVLMGYGGSAALGRVDMASMGLVFLQNVRPTAATYAVTLFIGVAIGLASAMWPALQASRMTITQAMRQLD